jgi:hypothetical protein
VWPGVVPSKVVVGGAHPNSGSTVWCGGGSSTATSEVVEVLRGSAAVARGTYVKHLRCRSDEKSIGDGGRLRDWGSFNYLITFKYVFILCEEKNGELKCEY